MSAKGDVMQDIVKQDTVKSGAIKQNAAKIAVVIPCFNVRDHLQDVLNKMPADIWRIYCVNDACPKDSTGAIVETDRIKILKHDDNQGVGGAVMTGYRQAMADGADIVVKVDGDGQMDPALIPLFVAPIIEGYADYTKGNRFYNVEDVRAMPGLRLFGNAVLSFMTKLSSGYWNCFDPTNGYTAIHVKVLKFLPLDRIHQRYFFESDILFRLNTLRAVVVDVPMRAEYGTEESGLKISRVVGPFLSGHVRNFVKRIFYNYILRDFNIASMELVLGMILFLWGIVFGWTHWAYSGASGEIASAGTVMLAALPILVGVQLLLSFLQFDVQARPQDPIHKRL